MNFNDAMRIAAYPTVVTVGLNECTLPPEKREEHIHQEQAPRPIELQLSYTVNANTSSAQFNQIDLSRAILHAMGSRYSA
jgi:hypothetical protein